MLISSLIYSLFFPFSRYKNKLFLSVYAFAHTLSFRPVLYCPTNKAVISKPIQINCVTIIYLPISKLCNWMWANSLIISIDLLNKYYLLTRVAIRYANENSREINSGKLIRSRAILFSHFQSRTQEASPGKLIDSFSHMHRKRLSKSSPTIHESAASDDFSRIFGSLSSHSWLHFAHVCSTVSLAEFCVWLRGSQRCCCCTDMNRIQSIFAEARDELFKRCSQFEFVSGEWKKYRRLFLLLPLARLAHRSPRLWAENINSRLKDTYKGNLLFELLGSVARSDIYIILIGWGHVTSLCFFLKMKKKWQQHTMKCIPWRSKVGELKIRLNSVWAFFFCCNQLFVFLAVPNDMCVCVYQAEWIKHVLRIHKFSKVFWAAHTQRLILRIIKNRYFSSFEKPRLDLNSTLRISNFVCIQFFLSFLVSAIIIVSDHHAFGS